MIKKMFKSKKFWYAIGAILIPIIAKSLGLPEAEVTQIFYAIVALILGQGLADIRK